MDSEASIEEEVTPLKTQTQVRVASPEDARAIAEIYNYYVTETTVTFEEEPVSEADMRQRMEAVWDAGLPWWVAERNGEIAGFAYAGQWKGRSAYRFAAEASVYVHPRQVRLEIGTEFYSRLLPTLKQLGLHVVIGVIALPNAASARLHERFGFVKVGHLKEVGFKFHQWIDVGFWQRIL